MTQATTGFADAGTLHYEAAGAGDPLVLCHAGFTDSRMWDPQWADFTRRTRAVRYDLRGYGKSGPADAAKTRREDLYALLKELGVERAHLLGCSLGGEVALDFALEHPERVSALILVSTVPGGFEFQGEPPALLLEMIGAAQQGDVARAVDLQVRLWVDGPFRQPHEVDPSVRQQVAELARQSLQRGASAVVDARPLAPPARQRLQELHVPTLIVVGALDDPEVLRAAHVMLAEIEGATLATVPNSAHLLNMENPAHFNGIVTDFLASVR
jgi:pimeloyl-ACP methyl ester carboxylesterase